jgi:hypothetical protein
MNSISTIYAHFIVFMIILYMIIPLLNNLDNLDFLDKKGLTLFKQYYQKNILIDFITIYFILRLSYILPLDIPIIYRRIIVILLYDVLLSIYINQTPYKTGNILLLKEWSDTVGWFAIIWDLFYINLVGYISDNINIESDNMNILIIGIINFGMHHL